MSEPAVWVQELGVSREAADLYASSEVIDLHIDSFIGTRLFGYNPTKRHGGGPFRGRLMFQADLPRLGVAGIGGAIWVITTNPFRSSSERAVTFEYNLERMQSIFANRADAMLVRTTADYRAARASKRHAVFVGIQGGNALDAPGAHALLSDTLIKVTLVHLMSSSLGGTSTPGLGPGGLTDAGRLYVQALGERRIFLDLAHSHPTAFWDAIAVHDRALPLLVSHTCVAGVHPHWRNLDDMQLRAVAATGGVVGIMYHQPYLGPRASAETIVLHLEHVVRVAGEDTPALGSDWDGLIITPSDMPTCRELPRLVDIMLRRGWTEERVRKVLGGNFLRALTMLRG